MVLIRFWIWFRWAGFKSQVWPTSRIGTETISKSYLKPYQHHNCKTTPETIHNNKSYPKRIKIIKKIFWKTFILETSDVIDIHTYTHTHIHTYIQTDRQTDRQTYIQTYAHTDYAHTHIHTYHTVPYRSIPYHTIPYHIIHTIPYHTIPYHTKHTIYTYIPYIRYIPTNIHSFIRSFIHSYIHTDRHTYKRLPHPHTGSNHN